MAMTSHAYGRPLAASPLASAAVGTARVKLVFADEIGTFVRRHRGFSACWYLIPRTARFVGDMLHEIAQEFELRARCPLGIELLLDGFHMLANQEIDMVRDNDTLVVQCVAFVGDHDAAAIEHSDKRLATKRKRKQDEGELAAGKPSKKKSKRAEHAAKVVAKTTNKAKTNGQPLGKKKQSKEADASNEKQMELPQKLIAPTATLDSTSDASSSSSDSSSDEEAKKPLKPVVVKATKDALKQTAKIVTQDAPVLSSTHSNTADSSSSDSDSDSDSNSSSSEDDKQVPSTKAMANGTTAKTPVNGKQNGNREARTRRRRRPRRRPKSGAAPSPDGNGTQPTGNQVTTKGKTGTPSTSTPTPVEPKVIRPLRIRGVLSTTQKRGTNHVRFDGSQKPVVQAETAASSAPPGLHRYGPNSTSRRTHTAPTNAPLLESAASNSEEPAVRKSVKEMWKRPYEIISSIHDMKQLTDVAAKDSPTLESLLTKFPTTPASTGSTALQTDDIVAYKTLTLCMETFQPVVSDWLGGQIVDVLVDDQSVTLIPYTLVPPTASADPTLSWVPSQPHLGEDACVSVSQTEITELRYLHGPTKAHLDTTAS